LHPEVRMDRKHPDRYAGLFSSPMNSRLSFLSIRRHSSLANEVKARLSSLERHKTPPNTKPLPPRKKPHKAITPESIAKHREAMKTNFPGGWDPPRKLSRDAMDGLRALHTHNPEQFTTPVLAAQFRISPEAVRRILKSKWQPSDETRADMLAEERQGRVVLKTQRRTKEWEEVKRSMASDPQSRTSKRRPTEDQDGFELT